MAVKHTTMISASITAYSTAVGPSSDFKNERMWRIALLMGQFLEKLVDEVELKRGGAGPHDAFSLHCLNCAPRASPTNRPRRPRTKRGRQGRNMVDAARKITAAD